MHKSVHAKEFIGVGGAVRLTHRPALLAALTSWLENPDGPPLHVVTGAPGSGKSALLASLQSHTDEPLAVAYLRQGSLTDAATSIAHQLGLSKLGDSWTPAELAEALAAETGRTPVIVLDAVDEAVHPDEVVALLVIPLVYALRSNGTPACRIVVGIGPMWSDVLGLREAGGEVLDLDAVPIDELEADLARFLAAGLADLTGYADPLQEAIRTMMAGLVAHRLASATPRGTFLVAALYLNHLAMIPAVRTDDDARRISSSAPISLAEVLGLDPSMRGDDVRSVLATVAQAKGDGLPLDHIPDRITVYLRESTDADGTPLYRLRHQALADHLGSSRPLAGAGVAWEHAPLYLRRHAIQHAVDGDNVDALLTDPEFLTYADPNTLVPELWRARGEDACLAAAVYRTSLGRHRDATPDTRRRLLIVDALRFGDHDLARRLQGDHPSPISPLWATGVQVDCARLTLAGPAGGLLGLACTRVHGRPVAVTAVGDNTVRIWDLMTGQQIGAPLTGHTTAVAAVACSEVDGRPVAVTGDWNASVRMWDLNTGRLSAELTGHRGRVLAVACADLDGRPVAITGGDDSRVLVWDLGTGQSIGAPLTGHSEAIRAITCTRLNDRLIVVAGAADGMVRMWELASRLPFGTPLAGHTGPVFAIDCVDVDGRPVAVTGGEDGTVRRWDLRTGQAIGGPRTGHGGLSGSVGLADRAGRVLAVACARLDDRPVVISGAWDGTVRIWDVSTGRLIGTPPTEPGRPVSAAAWTTVAGRTLALTGDWSAVVKVFDVTTTQPLGRPLAGHADRVSAVACSDSLALTRDRHGAVHVWELTGAQSVGDPFDVGGDTASALACATVDGRLNVLTGGDHGVRVSEWTGSRFVEHRLAGEGWRISAIACTTLDGTPIVVAASVDGTVRQWDLATLRPLDVPVIRQEHAISRLACAHLDGRPVVVGILDGTTTAGLWDLRTGQPLSPPLTGHTGPISAVACAELDGRPVALTASWDSTVLLWDMTTGQPTGTTLAGHTDALTAIACTTLDGRPVALTASADGTVALWDLATGTRLDTMPMPAPPAALAAAEDGRFIVAADRDIYVFGLSHW